MSALHVPGNWRGRGRKPLVSGPERYQKPCLPGRQNHSWNAEGMCRLCKAARVAGAQRQLEWRLRNYPPAPTPAPTPETKIMSDTFKSTMTSAARELLARGAMSKSEADTCPNCCKHVTNCRCKPEEKDNRLNGTREQRKATKHCVTCRGQGWVWLMNPRTVQREVGNCPTCGGNPVQLQADKRPARTGFHYISRA